MDTAEQQQIKKVKEELKLPKFQFNEFLEEIDMLIDESEHKKARLLLELAALKIKYTGKEAGSDEYTAKEMLDCILDSIWKIEIDIDNFYNIDFDEDKEPQEIFQYSFYQVGEIINPWKVDLFYSIEKRLIREGFFFKDGTWRKDERVLVYLINRFYSEGFFKNRTPKGRWYSRTNYLWFFENRYGVYLGKFINYGEVAKIEDKDYLPWLTEYLKV
jgi:CRISPR/Cas system CSM-associated protein Csm2 small subunit